MLLKIETDCLIFFFFADSLSHYYEIMDFARSILQLLSYLDSMYKLTSYFLKKMREPSYQRLMLLRGKNKPLHQAALKFIVSHYIFL